MSLKYARFLLILLFSALVSRLIYTRRNRKKWFNSKIINTMTLVKFNHQPVKTFSSLVDDIFNGKFINRDFVSSDFFGSRTPVNITETKDAYVLDVVAPGLAREDFKIKLDAQTLTISAEKES